MARDRRKTAEPPRDHVSRIEAQWAQIIPGAPVDGMRIMSRARRLTLLSRAAIEGVFADHGIDAGEFDVLATLRRAGEPHALRPTELYQTLMISSGGLTDRLRRLEERGLVTREPSPQDGRSLLVRLTPKGLGVIAKAFDADVAIENEIVAPLSKAEREELVRLLAKILAPLEARLADDAE